MRFLAILLCLFLGSAWADQTDGANPIIPDLTTTISCTSASAATAITIGPNAHDGRQAQLELQNPGTSTIFVRPGLSTVTAAVASGYPVLQGQSKVITVGNSVTHIACITASATVTLYVTPGWGN